MDDPLPPFDADQTATLHGMSAQRRARVAGFEDRWSGPQRPSIDDFLSGEGEPRRALLEELVHVDLECRLKVGESVRVEEYLRRYPELARHDQTVLALIWTEYEARRQRQAVADQEFIERFPEYRDSLPWRQSDPAAKEVVWKPGDVILGVYEVKRLSEDKERAEGGMGVVYRVRHRGWDLDLAVKSPKPEMVQQEEVKRNFERECEAWVKLGLHPNIVSCYYVRRVRGIPRVFAEFIDGGSLADWIEDRRLYRGGPRDALQRILDIAIQVAWGLDHAHQRGLVHQDVKPGNVMMQGNAAKVTDFGLARVQFSVARAPTDSTQDSMAVSWGGMTPAYCSPEQLEIAVQADAGIPAEQRIRLSRRTDVWSWAVSVLAMFCGRSPCRHGGHTAAEVFHAYQKRGPDDASLPVLPSGLARLLRQCFHRNPQARPGTMNELASELTEIYREATGRPYWRQAPVIAELQAESLNNRAVSLLDLEMRSEAVTLLEEAWQRHPWQPQVTHNRGLEAWRCGRITDGELLAQFEELNKTRAEDWETLFSLGAVQLERGDVERAVQWLSQAMEQGGDEEVKAALDRARALSPQAPRCLRSFTGRPPYLTTAWLSEDGQHVLSRIDEKSLRLWDPISGRTQQRLDASGPGATALTAELGHELTSADDGTLRLWDLAAKRCVLTFREMAWGAASGAFTADGQRKLVAGDEYRIELREVASGRLLRLFCGHTGSVNSISLTADGRWALSGSSDRTIRLWELASGRCLRTFAGHTDPVSAVFLAPDGRWALSASAGKSLMLWNLEMLASNPQPFLAPMRVCQVTSSEDAGRAQAQFNQLSAEAQAAMDKGMLSEALDRLRTARALPGYEVARESLDLWAAAGRRCRRTGVRRAWCMQSYEGHAGDVCSVFLSNDGRRILSASQDKTLRLWQLDTGRSLRCCEGHTDWVRAAALLPDGRRALSVSWDKTLRLWDLASGRCVRVTPAHAKYINCLAVGADGQRALTGSWDGTLKLWDVASGDCLRTLSGHESHVNSVAISPDGSRAVSGSEDKTVRLWDLAAGRALRTCEGHGDWVNAVAMTSDARWLLSGGKDWSLRLWDSATGRCQQVLKGHSGALTAVALGPGGRWALSGSKDKTVRLWDLDAGRCVQTLEGHTAAVTSVCLSADGRWAVSGGEDNKLRLWEIDWDYEFPGWAEWDEAARPHLESFLNLHSPYADDRVGRAGTPQWSDDDLHRLLVEFEHRGLGWIRPGCVRKMLEKMATLRNKDAR